MVLNDMGSEPGAVIHAIPAHLQCYTQPPCWGVLVHTNNQHGWINIRITWRSRGIPVTSLPTLQLVNWRGAKRDTVSMHHKQWQLVKWTQDDLSGLSDAKAIRVLHLTHTNGKPSGREGEKRRIANNAVSGVNWEVGITWSWAKAFLVASSTFDGPKVHTWRRPSIFWRTLRYR